MSASPSVVSPPRSEWPAKVLGAFAAGDLDDLAWFDGGGVEPSVIGARADDEVRGDDAAALEVVQARWRCDRSAVWLGWLTYEFGSGNPHASSSLPGLMMRRYPAWVRVDVDDRPQPFGAVQGRHWWDEISRPTWTAEPWPLSPLCPLWTEDDYRARVGRALEFVAAGDTYQVNLAQPFRSTWVRQNGPLQQRVASAYADLRRRAPAPRGGLVMHPDGIVLSNSPEVLLEVDLDGAARSFPIKGTRRRDPDPFRDRALASELARAHKDAAEHVMIVDLVRNDLGRLALPGTVRAPAVPRAMTLPTVHHLVTEVAARLRAEVSLSALVEALFPAGSITGAPKRRTMEIIAELEAAPRGIYCGSLVMLGPWGLRMNVAIRTAVADEAGLTVHAGGGIVADSDPEQERLETWAKVGAFDPRPSP